MRSIARLTLAFAAALATVFALPALSQDLPNRVGRIAHIEGAAALYQDPDEGWARAYVNSPVTSENSVWTDPGSRAELRVGGTAMRLDEATQLDINRLDDDELDAFVPRGTVSVRVRHYERNERVIFNTPHARFSVRANGRYRVDVDPDREESRLTVFAGEARVGSDSGRIRVQAGKTVRVFGGSAPSYVVENAFRDPFDRWADIRDAGWVESRSVKYVSSSMTGYEDLDRYGSWREEPEFGALWFPTRVAADWAPYRHGRWDYVRPWGWTWVDDAPWGYAPFHYGRWVYVSDRWAWSPGRREVRPTWAPALVAFVGGSNFSVGVSSGSPSVGWYPLSPWDRYQPWYNASPTYVTQVNVIVRDSPPRDDRRAEWRERSRERGVTVVNRDVVVASRPVQQALIAVRPEVARQAQVAAPSIVLPSRNEVIQRRASVRTQVVAPAAAPPTATATATTPGAAPATQRPGVAPTATAPAQRGERAAGPAARPEFQRKAVAPPPAPEPAKVAPPPAQAVTPPTPAAKEQAREQYQKSREAEAQKAREDQAKSRQEQPREAEQQKAREQQKSVEEQRNARDAQAIQQRQQQQQQQQLQQQQQQQQALEAAKQQQQKAQEGAMRQQAQEAAKQQQAQEAAKQQQQKAQEGAMRQQAQEAARQQQQQAQEAAKQQQQQAQEAAKQQQQQAQETAKQQQQQAQEAAKQQQLQQRAQQAQEAAKQQQRAQQAQEAAKQQQPRGAPQAPPAAPQPAEAAKTPQERVQQQREERAKKAREEKDKEDEEKKGKAGR